MQYSFSSPVGKKGRFTIGFLDDNVDDAFHNQLMMGIFEAARKYDVNIIRFGSFSPFASRGTSQRNDIILDHIGQYDIDALLFLGWSKAGALYNHDDFVQRFSHIPLLSIGTKLQDLPSVYFAGEVYTRELIIHLINAHNCRNIAFVATDNPDGRNEAYINTMKEYGLYNPDLYVGPEYLGKANESFRGKKALSVLLEDRKVTFDAILSMYIFETQEIFNELKLRGMNIPKDVALVSYEAGEYGKFSSPEITTVEFPWMDLGFNGCEKMVELLSSGTIPFNTEVKGKIIYRNSCGCLSNSVKMVEGSLKGKSDKTLSSISGKEKKAIVEELASIFRYSNIDFSKLLNVFIAEYEKRSGDLFLRELAAELRKISYWVDSSNEKDMITVFRKLLMPYLAKEPDALPWSGDIFQQAQVLTREIISNINIFQKSNEKISYQSLQEISRVLVTKFYRSHLMDALGEGLEKMGIRSCRIFLFHNKETENSLFKSYNLEFEYGGSKPSEKTDAGSVISKQYLESILSENTRAVTLFAHILHVQNEFIGFVIFEPGPLGERMYQFMTAYISTALSGSRLLEKLDAAYSRLVEQAQREGMAEIASGILHSIGNTLNSVNASASMMRKLANDGAFDDLSEANAMLEKNMDNLEDFIKNNSKSKKLMQFLLRLETPFTELHQQLLYHTERLNEKVNEINEIIISQQSYAGIDTFKEELNLVNVLEDIIKLHSASIEKYNIKVQKDFKASPRVLFQKIKLFHILLSLINNSIEAMAYKRSEDRYLKFTVYEDDEGKYMEVADSGCGMTGVQLEKVFNNGYSTKKGRQGMGLSSSLSYMAEMNGTIIAKSDGLGTGASFCLKFRRSNSRI